MDPRRQLRRLVAAGAVACLSIALGTTAAFGMFDSSVSASTAVQTNTLQPPSGLSTGFTCQGANSRATVSWTATTSTFASGYKVQSQVGSNAASTATVTGTSSSTTTGKGTFTVTFTVWAYASSWTSSALTGSVTYTC